MLTVTNDFKTALTLPRQIDGKVVVNGSTTLNSSQINSIQREFKTDLFKTILKKVTIDSNVSIDKDDVVVPSFGLYVNNDFEYLALGSYKAIESPNLNKDTNSYQVSAYDKIHECMVSYGLTSGDITYPCSVRDLFVAIFTKLGWSTTGIPATFTNSTSEIEEDVFSNMKMTYRDVLDELCTICCMFLADVNGVPTLYQKTTTSETINEEFMSDTNVQIKNQIFFNALVFARAEESDNIYRKDDTSIANYGLHEFRVSNLQILSLNWRDNFIDAMWDYIKTFAYYSYEINTVGIGYLEPVDQYTLSIFSDTYSTLLLGDDLVIRDGISERIYADEPKETTTEYKYASETDKLINKTNLIVYKQNKQIQALIEKTNENENKITSLTITTDNIQTNVASTTQSLTNQISTLETSTSYQINAITSQIEDGVPKVKTNTGYTFDDNGFQIQKEGKPFSSLMDDEHFTIKNSGVDRAFFGYDSQEQKFVSRIEELEARRITSGYHRCEPIMENGKPISAYYFVGGGN